MNESLHRALLRADLSDEDVAARLGVDPKTVRRWLSGRTPYLRHRWALAQMLGQDEATLWPQLRRADDLPAEITAVHPHRDLIPTESWRKFFGAARREIAILADAEFVIVMCHLLPGLLARQAEYGVLVRICIPQSPAGTTEVPFPDQLVSAVQASVGLGEVRVLRRPAYHLLCRCDDDLLVAHSIFGTPPGRSPIISLRRGPSANMAEAYLASFEQAWSAAWLTLR